MFVQAWLNFATTLSHSKLSKLDVNFWFFYFFFNGAQWVNFPLMVSSLRQKCISCISTWMIGGLCPRCRLLSETSRQLSPIELTAITNFVRGLKYVAYLAFAVPRIIFFKLSLIFFLFQYIFHLVNRKKCHFTYIFICSRYSMLEMCRAKNQFLPSNPRQRLEL